MISICPMSGRPCRGPECPMLVSYERVDGGFRYYCGLNSAIPKGGTAWEITPAKANKGKGARPNA